jgi:hypothetical protein
MIVDGILRCRCLRHRAKPGQKQFRIRKKAFTPK